MALQKLDVITGLITGLIDRSGWDHGPWDQEPDRVFWVDKKTGLPCLAKRNHHGAWCGYVGVPKNHPLHGKTYSSDDPRISDLEVHGGITYGDECDGRPEEGICHVSDGGDHVWWLGFDCLHFDDKAPGMDATLREVNKRYPRSAGEGVLNGHYRTVGYVRRQVRTLARQLKAIT